MIIDNRKTTIGVQLRKLLFLVLLGIAIVLFYYMYIFRDGLLGISGQNWTIGLVCLYIAYYLLGIVRNYHYFFYNDMGGKLVFRYYSLAPLSKRQHSVEIPKDSFYKFDIVKKLFGLQIYIVLYQKTPQGIAKYPPISLGLIKSSQRNDLQTSLKMFQKSR
jgi:hypothetical protein